MIRSYYDRLEISNSDLNEIKRYFNPPEFEIDPYDAYRMGTLVDCYITERHKIDTYRMTCGEYKYTPEELEVGKKSRDAFYRDPYCASIIKIAEFQKVSVNNEFTINYGSFSFTIRARCKWDFFIELIKMGGDIKSTVALTKEQFKAACEHFGYLQARSFYMDVAGTDKDMIIGISKKNFKVFKIPIKRGDENYLKGKRQYEDLCYKYWSLFDGFKLPKTIEDAINYN